MTDGHQLNGIGHISFAAEDVVICGAGGHARVVADILASERPGAEVRGFLDDRADLHGAEVAGLPVLGDLASWLRQGSNDCTLVVGIGDNETRERVARRIAAAGFRFRTAIHASAIVGSRVTIGAGTVLMPNAAVNADATLGEHVIINTSASVDHDCVIEDFSHISPGVNLAGGVTVGRGAHIGIGASVVPGVSIGEWSVVGAGATVVSDIPAHTTVVGTPAVPIRTGSAAR